MKNKIKNSLQILILLIMMLVVMVSLIFILKNEKSVTFETTGKVIHGEAIEDGELDGLEVSVIIPDKYQKVQPGEMIQFQITLKNIKAAGRHDIPLDYYIKKNEIILNHRREIKAIETQASFLSSIHVPEETLPGIYSVVVEIENERAESTFYVKSSDISQIKFYLIVLIVAILVVGGLIVFELHRLKKR